MSGSRAAVLCAAGLVALYLVVSLRYLDIVPPVHEDEPWQASTGFKLATEGVFGSDLMTGFYGMERRYYAFMPVHPLLLAGVFRVAGVGIIQARLETVLSGFVVLILTWRLSARLFDDHVAAASMAVLVLVPWLPISPYRLTGIPLLDQARIARYDLPVAAFALAALLAFLTATERRSRWRFAAAGGLVGIAGLCHLYGFFWLPVLLILGVWNREPPRHLAALVAGLGLVLLPYVVYVLADLGAWAAQTVQYASRFDLFDSNWYWASLRSEPYRYGFTTVGGLLRPGPLVYLVTVPVAMVLVVRRALSYPAVRAVAVPIVILPLMLALLISVKQPGYLLMVVPLMAVASGWVAVSLWRVTAWPLRAIQGAITLTVIVHGVLALSTLGLQARVTTPYPELVHRLRSAIPAGSRVLAHHRFWFGLEDLDVRSWWVPFALADTTTNPTAVNVGDSLNVMAPDVILVDDQVRSALADRPAIGRALGDYLDGEGLVLVATIFDTTYGRIDVYRRSDDSRPRSDNHDSTTSAASSWPAAVQ